MDDKKNRFYTWKKDFLSDNYTVYSDMELVGALSKDIFANSADGYINDTRYLFKSEGVFDRRTQIFDLTESRLVGEIVYDVSMMKANLIIGDKVFYWKNNNILGTNWQLFDAEGTQIIFSGTMTNGTVSSNIDAGVLLLIGLFIGNYNSKFLGFVSVIVIMAIFIVLIAEL